MLNSWSSSYKALAKKTCTRECKTEEKAFSEVVVDVRSRLFRYMRLAYANRNHHDRARSVFRAMRDLRSVGDAVTEKKRILYAAVALAQKEVSMLRVDRCTYVLGSKTNCPLKQRLKSHNADKRKIRLDDLMNRAAEYRNDMFNLEALDRCALALESYIMSDLDGISTMCTGEQLCLRDYVYPDADDSFESDRLCAKLSKKRGVAVLSEDFDCTMLFGADLIVTEVHRDFFVYVSQRDAIEMFNSLNRKDAVHKCCIMGTDYTWD